MNLAHPPGRADAVETGVGVLDRAMIVLEAVERGERSFTQIVAATGLTRSTTHRLLKALEEHGLLAATGDRGYRLGPRLLGLAASAVREFPLRDLAHPMLARLARDTGESAQLYVREGDRRMCVDAVESTNELRTIVSVGASLPLTKGSAGKVFLAWAGPRDRERLFATVGGTQDAARLARQVASIRRRGWSASVGEREAGVASVSAPVLDRGTIVAAISVSGPANRLGGGGGKRYAPAVTRAAEEVAETLRTAS